MTLVMCSGVETIVNVNQRPVYREHRAVVVACFLSMTLAICSGVETIANINNRHLYSAFGAVVVACFDL